MKKSFDPSTVRPVLREVPLSLLDPCPCKNFGRPGLKAKHADPDTVQTVECPVCHRKFTECMRCFDSDKRCLPCLDAAATAAGRI